MSRNAEPASIAATLDSIEEIIEQFRQRDYVCDRSVATAVFLGLRLERPLLLDG